MIKAIIQTLVMVSIPTVLSVVFGLILGSILFLKPKYFYYPTYIFVNTIRSFPFLIFVVLLIPLTRFVFKTAFGVIPASFPICFIGICLYSRFVEQSFSEVKKEIIEYALSLKVNKFQLVRYFLIPESAQSLVLGLTSCIISLISYSTVMGIVGGGGLGDYALRYGYYEYNYRKIFLAVVFLIILVFLIQIIGNYFARKISKRREDYV